ncbi:MAG: hypothetical protein VKK42_31350 [Lyngbya sp.]|nr:hypothetical protein [Lyngbya sp.]
MIEKLDKSANHRVNASERRYQRFASDRERMKYFSIPVWRDDR